ncbi:hypothetical protein WN943_007784 [Citrus x changshan-huyou]
MDHKHILKLIGCCLETPIPILVFEYGEYRTLPERIGLCGNPQPRPQFEPLRLKHRLKIAMDIAHTLAYLHVGFPRPIVFRQVIPSRILFNEENVAKLFDFSLSISIPEGETHITDCLMQPRGYCAPEYVPEYVPEYMRTEAYVSVQILLEKLQHCLSKHQASHRPQVHRKIKPLARPQVHPSFLSIVIIGLL